jgi:NADH:ubiquinone oxidoreductase subunit 5 (subunit L)/multisubunit Na+/H+ antiporter MnhA subunit
VENIGIIVMGIGLGELGLATGRPALAALGFAGALLHVLNHAVFKGLLFLGAGAVLHAAGTADLDRLGGLAKRMRWTSATFLVGAAAISGLPPLNGFVSEFLIGLSAVLGLSGQAAGSLVPIGAVVCLGLIGALAAACFAKAFGIAFLGEPRSEAAAAAHEAGPAMRIPIVALAALCAALGLAAPAILPFLASPVRAIGVGDAALREGFAAAIPLLTSVTVAALALVALTAALILLRRRLLARRSVRAGVTWDCGYARPTARMQYTGASFVQPLTDMAAPLLRTRVDAEVPAGLHPAPVKLSTDTPDPFTRFLFAPLFRAAGWLSDRLRWLQQGRTHFYVLYVVAVLVVLLLLAVK